MVKCRFIESIILMGEHLCLLAGDNLINCHFNFQNLELKDLLPYGFAIHHAGMSR